MDLTGRLLDVEHKAGDFTNDKGENIAYDLVTAHIIVGKRVVKVSARRDDKARLTGLRDQIGKDVTIPVMLPEKLNIASL